MSLVARLHLGYAFDVRAGFDDTFALLADVPASLAHFPEVSSVEPVRGHGRGVWRTRMVPVGPPQAQVGADYVCRYVARKAQGLVRWEPVEGLGNAQVSGSWAVQRGASSTAVELDLQGELVLPLPPLLVPVVEPLVQQAFEQRVERYIDNLIRSLGGEA
jgi:hypothetical protein